MFHIPFGGGRGVGGRGVREGARALDGKAQLVPRMRNSIKSLEVSMATKKGAGFTMAW